MSEKCLKVLVPAEKCQKNVPLQLAGKGLRSKMSKKCPTHIVYLKKCQNNVPRHCGRQGSRRKETKGRSLTVCVTSNLIALTPKSLTPCHLPGVSLLCLGEAWTNASRRSSVQLPISFIHISRIWCVDIETKKVMYERSIQFGNGGHSASMRLVCGQYTAACMRAIYIIGVYWPHNGRKLSVY